MKKPKEPTKPDKPVLPPKKIYRPQYIDVSELSTSDSVSLFIDNLQLKLSINGLKAEETKLVLEGCGDSDGDYVSIKLQWSVEIDNPYYKHQMSSHKEQNEKYNKEMIKYKSDMEKYLVLKKEWDEKEVEKTLKNKRELLKQLKKELGDA